MRGGGGYCTSCLENELQQSVLSFVTKKTNDNFLSKILSCSQCNQQHPPFTQAQFLFPFLIGLIPTMFSGSCQFRKVMQHYAFFLSQLLSIKRQFCKTQNVKIKDNRSFFKYDPQTGFTCWEIKQVTKFHSLTFYFNGQHNKNRPNSIITTSS